MWRPCQCEVERIIVARDRPVFPGFAPGVGDENAR